MEEIQTATLLTCTVEQQLSAVGWTDCCGKRRRDLLYPQRSEFMMFVLATLKGLPSFHLFYYSAALKM